MYVFHRSTVPTPVRKLWFEMDQVHVSHAGRQARRHSRYSWFYYIPIQECNLPDDIEKHDMTSVAYVLLVSHVQIRTHTIQHNTIRTVIVILLVSFQVFVTARQAFLDKNTESGAWVAQRLLYIQILFYPTWCVRYVTIPRGA